MDVGVTREMFDSSIKSHRLLAAQFGELQREFGFEVINANRRVQLIQSELRQRIGALLGISNGAPAPSAEMPRG